MKTISYLLVGLCLVACSKTHNLGGVNVGNGNHPPTLATYVSPLGLQLEYEKDLRLSVSSDQKTVILDNGSLVGEGAKPSQIRLRVFEFDVDQALFNEDRSLELNLPVLRQEAQRRFPGMELSEVRRIGALGFVGYGSRDGREQTYYILVTTNYDLVVMEVDLDPGQQGGVSLIAASRTLFAVTRKIKVEAIRLPKPFPKLHYSAQDKLRFSILVEELGAVKGGTIRGCFYFRERNWPEDCAMVICEDLVAISAEHYEVSIPVSQLQGEEKVGSYALTEARLLNCDGRTLAHLVPAFEGDGLYGLRDTRKGFASGFSTAVVNFEVR